MFEIILIIGLFLMGVIPMGKYLYHIADGQKNFADPIFRPIETGIFKLAKVDQSPMNWKQYVKALMLTNVLIMVVGYGILRLQAGLGLNPNEAGAMGASLALHTVISFMTNTNLQHYVGETGLSYLSQMLVITFMMFTSAATGYAACMAFIRGIAGKENMGNFYVDFVKIILRVLLPMSILIGILLIWQGVPQTLAGHTTVQTLEGKYQDLAMGPIASLEAIKHLGTNGGGYLGGNSTTPFENPTFISNGIEMLSMMILPGSCVVAFGMMLHKKKEGRSLFAAMMILFLIGLGICLFAERSGNPQLALSGISQSMGNMEGKEVRFGTDQSALFTTITTAFTTGSVNNMHDSLTPIGGMIALINMMMNVAFGGKGVGLMNMILYALLTVFICGLMIGRTPEYLGKKVEAKEMKLVAICMIIHPLIILGFTALAVSCTQGMMGISNPGYHGLSQILYEYTSAASNNGSGFEGLKDNTMFWNLTTAAVMFFGRYLSMILQLAIAHSLMTKRKVNESAGTLQTGSLIFIVTLVLIVFIFSALTFLPVLALGPVAEHLTLWY